MTEIISSCSDPNLLGAIEKQWVKYSKIWELTGRVEIHENSHFYAYSTGWPHPAVNGVGLAHLKHENIDHTIEETKEYFEQRNLPWTWWVGPTTTPSNLGEYLEKRGMTRSLASPAMAINLDSITNKTFNIPNFEVKVVDNVDVLRDWVEVAAVCFPGMMGVFKEQFFDLEVAYGFGEDLPKRSYIGYLDDEPVATSTFVLRYGVAGLFNIGTLPDARRRGIGTEMTLIPMREARSLGCKVAVLQSSPMGHSVYIKIGFKEYCKIFAYRLAK